MNYSRNKNKKAKPIRKKENKAKHFESTHKKSAQKLQHLPICNIFFAKLSRDSDTPLGRNNSFLKIRKKKTKSIRKVKRKQTNAF